MVLGGVDPTYPVFVPVLLLVEKSRDADTLIAALQRLKLGFVGHDQLILHERDIWCSRAEAGRKTVIWTFSFGVSPMARSSLG